MVFLKEKVMVIDYPRLVINYQSSKFKNMTLRLAVIDYHPMVIDYHVKKMQLFINQNHYFEWQSFMEPFQTYASTLWGF